MAIDVTFWLAPKFHTSPTPWVDTKRPRSEVKNLPLFMIAAVVVCTAFDCRQIRRKNMLFCRTNCYASVTEYSRSERLVVQVENDLCSEQTIVVDETATKNATCLIELARPRRRPLERARRAPVSWNYTEEFHSCLLGLPALARTGENCWIAGCLRVEGGGGGCGGVVAGWRNSNYGGAAQSKSPPKYYSVASSFP